MRGVAVGVVVVVVVAVGVVVVVEFDPSPPPPLPFAMARALSRALLSELIAVAPYIARISALTASYRLSRPFEYGSDAKRSAAIAHMPALLVMSCSSRKAGSSSSATIVNAICTCGHNAAGKEEGYGE